MYNTEKVQFVIDFILEHGFKPQDWRKIHDAIVLIDSAITMSEVITGATKVQKGILRVEEKRTRKPRTAASTKGDCVEFASYVSGKGNRFNESDKRLILDILKSKWQVSP